ncbi:ABC transporter permease [Marinibaculum pumilum]|uniref:ABC transporter permease n=1 Tax=Marinibaculum pumilum TaxID=1766165 RepID=A0ABV7KYQ1_9PROT
MSRFIARRLLVSLLVAISVSIIGFTLLRLSGDLARELAGDNASVEDIARTAALYGLDKSLVAQYFDWLGGMFRGDMGRSLFTNESVAELIGERIWVTVILAIGSLLLALGIGIPLGVVAAWRPNSLVDRFALTLAVFGQAIPNFWFGLMLIVIFGVQLQWLPISGSETPVHFILPVVTLGLSVMPQFTRLTRSGMLDALNANYIRAARSKGLPVRRILFRHALPNAVLPIVSLAAVTFGFLLGGSVIVESVFALNGIGYLAYTSILRQDFPVVQSVVVMVSLAYIVLTFLADLVNARLDPRIRPT